MVDGGGSLARCEEGGGRGAGAEEGKHVWEGRDRVPSHSLIERNSTQM